jgi:hypothetical protein
MKHDLEFTGKVQRASLLGSFPLACFHQQNVRQDLNNCNNVRAFPNLLMKAIIMCLCSWWVIFSFLFVLFASLFCHDHSASDVCHVSLRTDDFSFCHLAPVFVVRVIGLSVIT